MTNNEIINADNITSLIKDVVFLDIETSGINPNNSEILEIGAIKIDKDNNISIFNTLIKNKYDISPEIFTLCKDLKQKDLDEAPKLEQIKKELLDFLEDKTIVCHNKDFEKSFFDVHIKDIKNRYIDSMELAAILEPYHKEFNLDYLKKTITNDVEDERHRAIYDVVDTINVVNSLILRYRDSLQRENRLTLDSLTFEIDSFLNRYLLGNWDWSDYINSVDFNKVDDYKNVKYKNNNKKISQDKNSKEEKIYDILTKNNGQYENLLKEKEIWNSKKGFVYEFRQGQYELSQMVRNTFNSNQYKISCIEAPTGIGKSVGYLLPAILEARYSKKRIIISTATKELQVQLIDKDIPNVINSIGLEDKVSYGYIKGKNNYICKVKFEEYKKEYSPQKPTYRDILSLIIIENLIKQGEYGDVEEINYWILNHFEEISNHLFKIRCESELCKPKKCYEKCLYKKRVEELKEEDITVINHSLLAKWPYKDEKPLENIIVDEAHDLAEKGYDFFSLEFQYKSFLYFLREIYPNEFSKGSRIFSDNIKNHKSFVKPMDRFYTYIKLDRDIKSKISKNINFIYEKMNEILDFAVQKKYTCTTNYDLSWELNIQADEEAGVVKYPDKFIKLKYNAYSDFIKLNAENILSNIKQILILLDRNMDDDSIDKEDDVYKYGKSKIKDLEDTAMLLEKLLEYEENDMFARIVTISRDLNDFILKIVPLNLADLFKTEILDTLDSAVFVSATLSVDNNMNYFTNTLGIDKLDNTKKIIEPIYNYKNRLNIIKMDDSGGYKSKDFIENISETIKDLSEITSGNILSLFNSKQREYDVYKSLKDDLHRDNINLYLNKKGIKQLKNIENKSVVLGSKGCFEGVDMPGDALICVTLDKMPNLNPKDPLYYSIRKTFNRSYFDVNYPQMIIKIKQALGRILRSKYDYGIFVIFDLGNKQYINKKLEQNLHGCRINSIRRNNLKKQLSSHLKENRKTTIINLIKDILKVMNLENKDLNLIDYLNSQIKDRSINASVSYYKEDKILVKYYDLKYIVSIDEII